MSEPITREQCISTMSRYGYSLQSTAVNGGQIISLTFLSDECSSGRLPVPVYACRITLETQEFELFWCVPGSINSVVTPKCSPVTNEDHFNKIAAKFESHIAILNKYIS